MKNKVSIIALFLFSLIIGGCNSSSPTKEQNNNSIKHSNTPLKYPIDVGATGAGGGR